MCQSIKENERYCLCCHQKLNDLRDVENFFLADDLLCPECKNQMIEHKKMYHVYGTYVYVLYEYSTFIERLFFQYKEQRDIVLKDVFLHNHMYLKKHFDKYCVCALCSSDEKRMFRGFEPVIEMYRCLDVDIYSPFYKKRNLKQSNQSKDERKQIKDVLALKTLYPLPSKKIMLVDDVCTTGNTLSAAIDLLHPDCAFVLAAHPLWIQTNQENMVVKSKWFW